MEHSLGKAAETVLTAIHSAIEQMAQAVPPPKLTKNVKGDNVYRYVEADVRQALVLKSVRLYSALRSLNVLCREGLVLDAGACMRIIDEHDSDIMFLAGPILFAHDPEPRHDQYLTEFFQEEFDHPDPLQATQRRNRVSRRDIRAYVARTWHAGMPVHMVSAVTETIDSVFSGYIHGAAVHTMDVFDGYGFVVPVRAQDRPFQAVVEQLPTYLHRSTMAVAIAAKTISDDIFDPLYKLQDGLFTAEGRIR